MGIVAAPNQLPLPYPPLLGLVFLKSTMLPDRLVSPTQSRSRWICPIPTSDVKSITTSPAPFHGGYWQTPLRYNTRLTPSRFNRQSGPSTRLWARFSRAYHNSKVIVELRSYNLEEMSALSRIRNAAPDLNSACISCPGLEMVSRPIGAQILVGQNEDVKLSLVRCHRTGHGGIKIDATES